MAKIAMYTTKLGERRFQVSAPIAEEIYRGLKALAREQDTSVAAQVRKAVIEYLARHTPASRRVG